MQLRLTIILLTLLVASQAAAISPFAPRGKGNFGVKAGIISKANVNLGMVEYQSEINITMGLFWEVPVHKRIWSGIAADLHNVTVTDQQQFFINIGVPIKYRWQKSRLGVATIIGITPGFGHLANITFLNKKPTNYFTLTGSFELQLLQEKERAWVIELAVFRTVTGGNRYLDVTIGPAYLFRLGYIL